MTSTLCIFIFLIDCHIQICYLLQWISGGQDEAFEVMNWGDMLLFESWSVPQREILGCHQKPREGSTLVSELSCIDLTL